MRWRVVQASVTTCRSTYSSSLTSFCCVNICFGCIDPGGWCWRTLSWDPSFPSPQFARKFEMPTSGKGRRRMIIKTYLDSACEFDRHADPARSGLLEKCNVSQAALSRIIRFFAPKRHLHSRDSVASSLFPSLKTCNRLKEKVKWDSSPRKRFSSGTGNSDQSGKRRKLPCVEVLVRGVGLKMSTRAGSRLARPQIFISRLACPCRSSGLRNSVHGIGLLLLR